MSSAQQEKKNNYLYLVWKNPADHSNYIVGTLSKDEGYSFEYSSDFLRLAEKECLELLHAFPEGNKKYNSTELFPSFASRLPDKKRRDIDAILKKYELDQFDEFELLRRGGGRLPIDTYEFVDPIFPEDKEVNKDFYIKGIRHYDKCNGENCLNAVSLEVGEELGLKLEPENKHDSNAVQIYKREMLIGYVPKYYSEAISTRLRRNISYSCIILEVTRENICDECVKVKLSMPRV